MNRGLRNVGGLYNFVMNKQSVESVCSSQSRPTIYPLAFEKKAHARLTFHLVPFFRSQNHPFGCIIAQDERKKRTGLRD